MSLKTSYITTAMCLVLGVFFSTTKAIALKPDLKSPVEISADDIIHSDQDQEVWAEGNVELVQGKKILQADRISYSLHHDRAVATGSIKLLDENGDVHFMERLELTGDLRDGFVKGLRSVLADGSRFTAEESSRENGTKMTMKMATYTACKVCKENPDKAPIWRIKADKITYDQEKKEVDYKNARLEFFGVPIAYTPIFSHPDPTQRQKSGFLRPSGGWSSDLGTYVNTGYYWGISPDKDMTFNLQPTTRQGVLSQSEYRQRFRKGLIKIAGGVAFDSKRTKESGAIEENKTRAYIDAEGRLDLTDTWRMGFDLERASDKEFLRLYNVSNQDILESQVFAERFSGRNYTRIEAASFQDVRLGDRITQPEILPWFQHTMYGTPNKTLGGRWMFGLGSVGLYRSDNEQDMFRASMEGGWERQFLAMGGIKTVVETNTRADVYAISDHNAATIENNTEFRIYPYLHAQSSYPLVKPFSNSEWIVEPIISATIAGNVDNGISIPNEDSIDVQLDVSNLFEATRFPGVDRLEDGGHISAGVKTGLYGHNGWYGEVFLGQSVQFNEEDGLFPDGSGLAEKYSDIVGQLSLGFGDRLDLDYKIQLDNNHLNAQRHEFVGFGTYGPFDYDARYVFASAVDGTGFIESREQLELGAKYKFTEHWQLDASALTDLGEEPGLRRASLGLHYGDECFTFSLMGERNLSNRASGENETSLLLRLGLKHLGEISTPEILLDKKVE